MLVVDYRSGRIMVAFIRTKTGKRELHPVVIMSPNSQIIQPSDFDPRTGGDNVVVVMGVSTKYLLHQDPFIKLPFHPAVHPVTRLSKDCAAILGWYDVIHIPDERQFWAGDVPTDIMLLLNEAVRKNIAASIGREFSTLAEAIAALLAR